MFEEAELRGRSEDWVGSYLPPEGTVETRRKSGRREVRRRTVEDCWRRW